LTQDQEKESGITWEWPTSPYWLSAGSTLPCILDSGIRSEHRATIVARIPVTIFDSLTGRIPVIEADSVVIGQYQGATYGESSIAPIWERLVMALTKAEIPLNGWRGADATGMAGLKGEVDHKWLPWIGSIFFSSMLEAGAASVGVLGADRVQRVGGMVAQDLAGQASGKISRNANLSPTHIIAPGTHCSIPLVRGVDLQPQALEVKR
jgi:type IV secretion system protein VirB10